MISLLARYARAYRYRIALRIGIKALRYFHAALEIYQTYPNAQGSAAWAQADAYITMGHLLTTIALIINKAPLSISPQSLTIDN